MWKFFYATHAGSDKANYQIAFDYYKGNLDEITLKKFGIEERFLELLPYLRWYDDIHDEETGQYKYSLFPELTYFDYPARKTLIMETIKRAYRDLRIGEINKLKNKRYK